MSRTTARPPQAGSNASSASNGTANSHRARQRILGRLRENRPVSATAVGTIDSRIDTHYETRRAAMPASLQARIDQFQRMLEAAHAEVFRASADAWPAELARRLATAGVRRVLVDRACPEGAALARALPASVAAQSYEQPIEAWKDRLFETIDAGFTVVRSGIAATGTLIVEPDAGSPRSASLVPPLHVALIHAHTLHADLHAAVADERWRDGMPTNLVLVSGPSKTSDIQQTLAYGAHGPRALWVVIVTDEADEPHTA